MSLKQANEATATKRSAMGREARNLLIGDAIVSHGGHSCAMDNGRAFQSVMQAVHLSQRVKMTAMPEGRAVTESGVPPENSSDASTLYDG